MDSWQLAEAVNLRPEIFGGMAFHREHGVTLELDTEAYRFLCSYLTPRPLPSPDNSAACLTPQLVRLGFLFGFGLVFFLFLTTAPGSAKQASSEAAADRVIVLTQLPRESGPRSQSLPDDGPLRGGCRDGARIVRVGPGSEQRVLTTGFLGACDPDVSYDGRRMLFAGKRDAGAGWEIYEMQLDGSGVRQVTHDVGDCRSPVYQGPLYTIEYDEPWYQFTFVSARDREANEWGGFPATNLYTARLDGSAVRRITFNPSSDLDPTLLPDGRLLFASWQRNTLERGAFGRISLFAAQIDGLDYAIFAGDEGLRVKRMPTVTSDRLVVFVESDELTWDGSGRLASVSLRRNLRSHRAITDDADGLFHSPSPLPDGTILVSRRPRNGEGTHGVYRLDPRTGDSKMVFDDSDFHDIQARPLAARPEPDGRSSVVSEKPINGKLYCLDVYDSDRAGRGWIAPGTPLRLRVLEGIPRRTGQVGSSATEGQTGFSPLLQSRVLGEVAVEKDGSFNVEVPPEIPIQLQLVDDRGLALETCGWIWVRNRETRGCIGCHEDGERTPENRFVQALAKPAIPLVLPPDKRRTVDFRRDVMPILTAKCSSTACHGNGAAAPTLDDSVTSDSADSEAFNRAYRSLLTGVRSSNGDTSGEGDYVHPGRARTSPLVWGMYRESTARPWDDSRKDASPLSMPPACAEPLTNDEKRTIAEWIDLGALWTGLPPAPEATDAAETERGGTR